MGANGKLDDESVGASKKSSRERHLRKREYYDDGDERDNSSDKNQYGRDADRSRKDDGKSRDRSEREKRDGDRVKERDAEKTRDKDEKRSKDRDLVSDKERERLKEKEKSREKERDRDKDRERAKSRDREREKEKEREKAKRKERRDREAEFEEFSREKEKEKREKDKAREEQAERPDRSGLYREREKDEERRRERERELLKEREKKREKERRDKEREKREREKLEKGDDEDKDRDWKKRRKEEEGEAGHRRESEENDLDEEQKRLDEEVEKRRRRVQEWQELKRRKEEEERRRRGDTDSSTERLVNGKTWTLEGDDSDDEDGQKDGFSTANKVMAFENGDVVMAESKENSLGLRDEDVTGQEDEGQKKGAEDKQVDDDEEDPLDAFMNAMVIPEVEKRSAPIESGAGQKESVVKRPVEVKVFNKMGKPVKREAKLSTGRIIAGEDSSSDIEYNDDGEPEEGEEDDDDFMKRVKKSKAEKLALVDHSKVQYAPFRKNFYIEVKEISRRPAEEVIALRRQLELKVRGKDVPQPIKTWNQTGLSARILDVIKKSGFEKPMSIQAQALPIIMSGRDCIGVAKTGSGKTLAFVLPMLRHIMDQPPLAQGEGPIGLIMAPTRELVQQIYSDIKKFSKILGLTCVPVYGGSGVAQQISDLKRGAEIVVCTPGRMIDILCTSAGKIMNLRRVTYLVMDEADRMFDMGFEPQITRIVQNTRPDRQTVLFSATFPRQVEVLARKVLNKPVEIQVGGRSVANKDITQTVEVRPEGERFLRLLELLGEWYEKGKILIFVHSQEKCDSLFKDLLKAGYPCLSLHGAKDQTDRESTLADFKSNVCNLMIATSVAARGLDVKELELVVNYDVPNHYEDYVHRVGRTGRAGRKGVAVTFISAEEERYAPDLVKALVLSEQPIPEDLKKLADDFMAKVKQGSEQVHGSGYGGSGFKFNEEEDEARKAAKKAQAKEYGFEEDEEKSDSDSDDEGIRKAGGDLAQAAAAAAHAAAMAAAAKAGITSMAGPALGVSSLGGANPQLQAALAMAQAAAASQGLPTQFAVPGMPVNFPGLNLAGMPGMGMSMMNMAGMANMAAAGMAGMPGMGAMNLLGMGLTPGATPGSMTDGAARASAFAAALNLQHNLAKIQAEAIPEHYEAELEINDFPQHARWKVTHKDALGQISEWTGAAITTRGQFFPPGKVPAPGERKLFLFIEGPTEASVKKAKAEVKRLLEESTSAATSLPVTIQPGKYSVL